MSLDGSICSWHLRFTAWCCLTHRLGSQVSLDNKLSSSAVFLAEAPASYLSDGAIWMSKLKVCLISILKRFFNLHIL